MSTEFPEILEIDVSPIDIELAKSKRTEFERVDYSKSGSIASYSRAEYCPISNAIRRIYGFEEILTGSYGSITIYDTSDHVAAYYLEEAAKDFVARADRDNDNVSPAKFIAKKNSTRARSTF